jgi:hypothetical protein
MKLLIHSVKVINMNGKEFNRKNRKENHKKKRCYELNSRFEKANLTHDFLV